VGPNHLLKKVRHNSPKIRHFLQVVRSQKGGVDAIIDELLAISSQIEHGGEGDASGVIDEQNMLLNLHNKSVVIH
jgi:hypothetical protein